MKFKHSVLDETMVVIDLLANKRVLDYSKPHEQRVYSSHMEWDHVK